MCVCVCVCVCLADSVAGGRGEESGRKGLCVDSEFLSDMFGSDFYTTEEAVQLQQNRMEVCSVCVCACVRVRVCVCVCVHVRVCV